MRNVLLKKPKDLKCETVWQQTRLLDFAARLSAAATLFDDTISLRDALETAGIDPSVYPWLHDNLFGGDTND